MVVGVTRAVARLPGVCVGARPLVGTQDWCDNHEMTQHGMNGLRTIVEAIAKGDTTLHAIKPSPARADYASDEAWEAAFDHWVRTVTFWQLETS